MSAAAGIRVLPPPPPGHAWISGGVCAGALLGLAEVLASRLAGSNLPPALALGIAAADTLLVAVLAGLTGALVWALGQRPARSQFAGLMLAPVLLAPSLAAACLALRTGSEGGLATALSLFAGLLLAGSVALLAGRAGDRLERAGTVVRGPLLWLLVVSLLAISEAALLGLGERPGTLLALVLATALLAGLLSAASHAGPGAGRSRPVGFVTVAVLAWLGILVASFWSTFAPWLLAERVHWSAASGPPNLLVVALDAQAPADATQLAVLRAHSRYFRAILPDPDAGADALLTLPGDEPLLAAVGRHVATATFRVDSRATMGRGARHLHVEPGPWRLLERHAPFLTGAGLLLASDGPLLDALDLRRPTLAPDELSRAAEAWLRRWRVAPLARPFALVFDARRAGDAEPGHAEADDAALARLLGTLTELGVEDRSVVVVARSASGTRRGGVLDLWIHAPPGQPRPLEGRQPGVPVHAGEVARSLFELLETPAATPPGPR